MYGLTCRRCQKTGTFYPIEREECACNHYHENARFQEIKRENKRKSEVRLNLRFWSEWQDLNLRPLPPQAKGYSFLRDIASNTCFFVRKNWYKVRRVLLSPGSPVLKVVKHVVIKSAPNLMWSSIKGADNFFRAIVVRVCGRFFSNSAT